MTTRLVYRLLDPDDALLGWTEDEAELLGDGCLRASREICVIPEQSGIAHRVSIHWVDVNVETKVPLELSVSVSIGSTLTIFRRGAVVIRVGVAAGGLPPVVVGRSVTIGIPTGGMTTLGRS